MKTIETERLILRSWQLEYLDDLFEYAKNPDVGSMQGWEPHSCKEVSLHALKSYIEDDDRWEIVLKENRKVIGSVQLCSDENRGKYYAKYIHYVLSSDYWWNGYIESCEKSFYRKLNKDDNDLSEQAHKFGIDIGLIFTLYILRKFT